MRECPTNEEFSKAHRHNVVVDDRDTPQVRAQDRLPASGYNLETHLDLNDLPWAKEGPTDAAVKLVLARSAQPLGSNKVRNLSCVLLKMGRQKDIDLIIFEDNVVTLGGVAQHHTLGVLVGRERKGYIILEHASTGRGDGRANAESVFAIDDEVVQGPESSLRTTKTRQNVEVGDGLLDLGEVRQADVGDNNVLVGSRHKALALAKSVEKGQPFEYNVRTVKKLTLCDA